jgi:hypothetical protein
MSTEQQPPSTPTGTTRRASTSGGGRATGSIVGVVVAVVAVVLGFVILRSVSSDAEGGGGGVPVTTTAAPSPVETTLPPETTTTTLAPINKTGYKMVVANASGVGGSAGQLTIALQGQGFIVEPATNAATDQRGNETTVVYYLAGNEANATSVARTLGGVCIEPMPTPVPTERATLGEASVLVLLGKDLAGKPLPATTDDICLNR